MLIGDMLEVFEELFEQTQNQNPEPDGEVKSPKASDEALKAQKEAESRAVFENDYDIPY